MSSMTEARWDPVDEESDTRPDFLGLEDYERVDNDIAEICERYGVRSLSELPQEGLSEIERLGWGEYLDG